jgi:hypothetical protein
MTKLSASSFFQSLSLQQIYEAITPPEYTHMLQIKERGGREDKTLNPRTTHVVARYVYRDGRSFRATPL